MAHLKQRLTLVPFSELTDCPDGVHHAIGSPNFDPAGNPIFPDPIVVALRAKIFDPLLPRSSALAVSCNTRPYQSYGPLMKDLFEKANPHSHRKFRQGLEGVMEVCEIEKIHPGGLVEQTERVYLCCVAPMTQYTNSQILGQTLKNLAIQFGQLPLGSTLRMPLIGTGEARGEGDGDKIVEETVAQILTHLTSVLIPSHSNKSPRRLLLFHPFEHESHILANVLAERALFLSLLDKIGIFPPDSRLIYGLAWGEKKENQIVPPETFDQALDHFDQALEKLLKGDHREALKEAARGMEVEPNLRGICTYISFLASGQTGFRQTFTREIFQLAREGRVGEALCISQALAHGDPQEEGHLRETLGKAYIQYSVAALEARLLYENYTDAEEKVEQIYSGGDISPRFASKNHSRDDLEKLVQDLSPIEDVLNKTPQTVVENGFHIVIRKILAEKIELQGSRRALENIRDIFQNKKIPLSDQWKKNCQDLNDLLDWIEKNGQKKNSKALREKILARLEKIIPTHGTLHLEGARYFLESREKPSQKELSSAWTHLEQGHHHHPQDYGILSYLGLLIWLQDGKFIEVARGYYHLLERMLDLELSQGRFAPAILESPEGSISIPFTDGLTIQARGYYEKYRENIRIFSKMALAISQSEGTIARDLYRQAIQSFAEVGRYDLAQLYENLLGEQWISLVCRHSQSFGSIPTPFGEISLDFIFILYRKVKFWWKYKHLKSSKLQKSIKSFIEKWGKKI